MTDRCTKCGIECVLVDNPFRTERRPRRGLEHLCEGGEDCWCNWPPKARMEETSD